MKQKEALERETMMKEAKEREALQERLQREAKATEESKQRSPVRGPTVEARRGSLREGARAGWGG